MDTTVAWGGPPEPRPPVEGALGLRERKKQHMRQRLTDVATTMFLERGFDAVRVADVAAACEVSEKTVYNYYPTKESLLLDRWDSTLPTLGRALADRDLPPVDAAVQVLSAELDAVVGWLSAQPDAAAAAARFAHYGRLIADSPSLRAYQHRQVDAMLDTAAAALAERFADVLTEPQARVAAAGLVALWDAQSRSLREHLGTVTDLTDVTRLVGRDVQQAAAMLRQGLGTLGSH